MLIKMYAWFFQLCHDYRFYICIVGGFLIIKNVVIPVIYDFISFSKKFDADLTLLTYERVGVMKNRFFNEVVWITGASSGIGEHLAKIFAYRGAKLVLSGVNVEKLESLKAELTSVDCTEDQILTLPFSMEDYSVHEECVEKVIEKFGKIDVLVNNAGVTQRADFQDIDIEVDKHLFDVNVFGPVNLTRKALKYMMVQKKGHIVVTSSAAGKFGAPFSSSYTGSKHALHGYFDGLRTEMIPYNIKVTIACPGPVMSNLTSRCVTAKPGEIYDEKQSEKDEKMTTARCSELMFIAIYHQLTECWICKIPLLYLYYLAQYTPVFFRSWFMNKFFDKKKIQSRRAGK